jgi:hypothetical protein
LKNPTISPIPTFSLKKFEDLEAALEQFREIAADLGEHVNPKET